MKMIGMAVAAGAVLGAVAAGTVSAQAFSPIDRLDVAAAALAPVEQAQFIWGGQNYCFYVDGWHGPGWYRCGYAARRGLGWGGAEGWHGWRRGAPPRHGVIHGRPGPRAHPHHRPHAAVPHRSPPKRR